MPLAMPLSFADNRRLKILRVSRDILIGFFRQSGSVAIRCKGMPSDAMIVGVSDHIAFDTNQIALKIHSKTFPVTPDGKCLPDLNIELTSIEWARELDRVIDLANGKEGETEEEGDF